MAQYKVPQDVEADDKLLGPFSFRQLIYLFVAAGLIALAFALFQIFPLLAILPLPPTILFLALALPLRKDQPMETYLAALVSFYIKPNKRFWNPGQRDSTITITAPKKIEGPRIRTISEEEASHRLSFLADVIDSEGQSVTGNWSNSLKDEYAAEASSALDIFEAYDSHNLSSRLSDTTSSRHNEAIKQMHTAIEKSEGTDGENYEQPQISHISTAATPPSTTSNAPLPTTPTIQPTAAPKQPEESENPAKIAAMQELANNSDYTVATIAKEARRIEENANEVYISLH